MPVEEQNLEPEVFGSVTNQVLNILADNRGYYAEEFLEKIGCSYSHLSRVLNQLYRKGLINKKILPEESKKRGLGLTSMVYFKNPKSRDLR